MQVGGSKRGSMADMNVVPLIDILLVLLIIFMAISPVTPLGLNALVPQSSIGPVAPPPVDPIIVQVLADGKLRINQEVSTWESLGGRLEEIFKLRADRSPS
jgi:biopolymer transport protein TolR